MKRNKKNAQGAGTIRKRSDGRWEARFTIGFDPVNGKQKQKSIYGKTQKEVREKLAQVTVEIDEGTYIEPCQMTLEEWMTIWLAEYMGDKKWSTIKHYKAQVKSHILPALGHYPLSQLNPHIIQAFDNALLRGTGKEKPLTPKSVRNVHGVLRKCLAVAVQLEYIRRNPAEPVILPRVEKKIIKPLTDEEVQKMICAAGDDGFGTLFKVVVFTGLRRGEALGLTWDCVDFTKRRLTIDKQLQKRPIADGGFVFASLKNDKVRVVAPAPYVLDLLKEWEQRQKEWRLKCGPEWQGWKNEKERRTALVFTNEFGGHLHPQTVYNHFKKLAISVGAPNARVHDLRHTYAVLSLQNGDDVKTVQGNLGHATAAFTLDVYGHVSERMKEDSANRMQRYIEGLR